jgi:glutamate-1-semialdehyde 2,1-aminomutase
VRTETQVSEVLFAARRAVMPGGVTGDGRAETPYPLVFTHARGKHLTDVDGNVYLDYHGGLGTAILGYSHPDVDGAVAAAMLDGRTFVGCAHRYEAELAERLRGLLPEGERIALCGGGGSDAIYHAIRLSRAVTGRTAVIKVEGGYHGWHGDVGASVRPVLDDPSPLGSPPSIPNSAGILPAVSDEILVVSVNDVPALTARFEQEGSRIACVIVEPVLYSAGCIPVDDAYLEAAHELCTANGSLLVFDEVLSGFRTRVGGAAAWSGIVPDLGAYGKAVANGHVLSFLAGDGALMDELAPAGPVFYSGTFNGHPLGCAAAMATLDVMEAEDVHGHASTLTTRLADGINDALARHGVLGACQHFGSTWCLYFGTDSVRDYRDLARTAGAEIDAVNGALRQHLRERGIFIQRRPGTNRGFVSAVHAEEDIDRTVAVIDSFLAGGIEGRDR